MSQPVYINSEVPGAVRQDQSIEETEQMGVYGSTGPGVECSSSSSEDEEEEGPVLRKAMGSTQSLELYQSHTGNFTELDPKDVKLDPEPIASGAFGVVFHGKWRGVECAVKQLSTPFADAAAIEEFQKEAHLMERLGRHPNVVSFFGAITKNTSKMSLVIEWAGNGSVQDAFIKDQTTEISLLTTLKIARDAACGIVHLHEEQVIHRDIAARNILIGDGWKGIITDFGMSRINTGEDMQTTAASYGPVGWMAPECINQRAYSEKSDSWAFGVLIWEMITRSPPWYGRSPLDVAIGVAKKGKKLKIPAKCDPILEDLMRACWRTSPKRRPTMAKIYTQLNEYVAALEAGKDASAIEKRLTRTRTKKKRAGKKRSHLKRANTGNKLAFHHSIDSPTNPGKLSKSAQRELKGGGSIPAYNEGLSASASHASNNEINAAFQKVKEYSNFAMNNSSESAKSKIVLQDLYGKMAANLIESIDLKYEKMSISDVKQFRGFLMLNVSVKTVDMSYVQLGDEGVLELIPVFRQNKGIEELVLIGVGITTDGAVKIVDALKERNFKKEGRRLKVFLNNNKDVDAKVIRERKKGSLSRGLKFQ
eukprot:TRINITY_DN3719_c0_g1_i1.p1 TRINITY_DN3719_c0_g1~~TRINITY_DN3719_c0_g1_i1.p1  ORF type:complete len:592 (+),score=94.84 TRINITY_DN3719_c0_g1_i1:26-1801(+)